MMRRFGNRAIRYTVVLERDPDGLFVAHVPAMRGCVSQDRNRRRATRNLKEAVARCVETLIEHRQAVPTESGRAVVERSAVGK